jgi:hypothetical protein
MTTEQAAALQAVTRRYETAKKNLMGAEEAEYRRDCANEYMKARADRKQVLGNLLGEGGEEAHTASTHTDRVV